MQGRIAAEPKITIKEDRKRAYYPLAVERDYKKDDEQPADFFNCVAFGATAEFVEKYLKKGKMIIVEGRFKTNDTIDATGNKMRFINLEVHRHYFCDSNNNSKEDEASEDTNINSSEDSFPSLDV